jgi:hypothetical protein
MSDHRALPWGEKHLHGEYYTIKIRIGPELRGAISDKLNTFSNLNIFETQADKKNRQRFLIAGVLNQSEYTAYRIVKEEAQLQILVSNMREKASNLKELKQKNSAYKMFTLPTTLSRPIDECG